MVNREDQIGPYIRDYYVDGIHQIMAEHDIQPVDSPDHVVLANASFAEVTQHTDWYIYRGDTHQDYRYRRYREILGHITPSGRRVAHVDIGCGAGLFSWSFLDWAMENNLAYDRVDLYGFDHSVAMIDLAREMKTQLMQNIANYPDLHYVDNVDALLRELTEYRREATDYTVTFGHVLVQAHTSRAILSFVRVIVHIMRLLDAQSNCSLVAVDARGRSHEFLAGWNALLKLLEQIDVGHELVPVQATAINDDNGARIARLHTIR